MSKLPLVITQCGGALERIMEDPSAYVAEGAALAPVQKVALGRIVKRFPQLNSEEAIGTLIHLLAFHGLEAGGELRNVVGQYGIDIVALVVEYFYDASIRTRGTAKHVIGAGTVADVGREGNVSLAAYGTNNMAWGGSKGGLAVCELVERLREEGRVIDDVEALADTVEELGGLSRACNFSDAELAALLASITEPNDEDGAVDDYEGTVK